MTTAHRIILHSKQAQNRELREAVEVLRSENHDIDVRVTWEAGDGARLAQEAVALGIDNVIAAGGDGSINEVLQGIIDGCADRSRSAPSLGLIPLGTANDFCTSAGIPTDDLIQALRVATSKNECLVDVVHQGNRAFLNMATGGFGTDVTTETPDALKKALGGAAYFLTGVAKLPALEGRKATIRVGEQTWSGEFIAIAIGNGRQAGGGRVLCPDGLIDDGELDVSVLPTPADENLVKVMGALVTQGMDENGSDVLRFRGKSVSIDATAELTLNFDGEPVRSTSFQLRVAHRALRLKLPDSCPLLRKPS